MHYRTLGQTGLRVSEVGLGAMPFGGMVTQPDGTQFGWSGTEDRELIALVHRGEELGVNLLDTAAAYGNGHGEAVVGEALQGGATGGSWRQKSTPIKASMLIHRMRQRSTSASPKPVSRVYTVSRRTTSMFTNHAIPYPWAMPIVMATLAQLQEASKIRWYGISTNNREAIDQLRTYGPLQCSRLAITCWSAVPMRCCIGRGRKILARSFGYH